MAVIVTSEGSRARGRGLKSVLSVLLCAGIASSALAAVYKYVDADGIVHYTNIRPEGTAAYTTFDFPCYASDPDCGKVDWEAVPLNRHAFADEIDAAAASHAVEASLIRAIIHAESAYQPDAESPRGAQGLMQLMPYTAAELQVADPFDPESNIRGGARYLSKMLEEFGGDVELAAAAYNAGPGAVRNHGGVPPFPETREYVRRVRILYRRYRG